MTPATPPEAPVSELEGIAVGEPVDIELPPEDQVGPFSPQSTFPRPRS